MWNAASDRRNLWIRSRGWNYPASLDRAPQLSFTASAPSAPRQQVFKPNESFLDQRKKATPWYRVTDTTVSIEDTESIRDCITLGGSFTDVAVPYMYIKKLMCTETLKLFDKALTKAIDGGSPHCARTIVNTLRAIIIGRVPR